MHSLFGFVFLNGIRSKTLYTRLRFTSIKGDEMKNGEFRSISVIYIRFELMLKSRRSALVHRVSRSSHIRDLVSYSKNALLEERGDVPGWVLVVLMTTGLITGIWTVAAPRLSTILRGSLDSMNNVR